MAKKKPEDSKEFTLHDVRHHAARGPHHVFSAIEDALKRKCKVCDEVWKWITTNFWSNDRAKSLVTTHAPQFAPASTTTK